MQRKEGTGCLKVVGGKKDQDCRAGAYVLASTKLHEEAAACETPWRPAPSREPPCPIHARCPRAKHHGLLQPPQVGTLAAVTRGIHTSNLDWSASGDCLSTVVMISSITLRARNSALAHGGAESTLPSAVRGAQSESARRPELAVTTCTTSTQMEGASLRARTLIGRLNLKQRGRATPTRSGKLLIGLLPTCRINPHSTHARIRGPCACKEFMH